MSKNLVLSYLHQKYFLIISCIFLFLTDALNAQIIVKGSVVDSLKNPLPNASVVAQPKDSIGQVRFAITGNDGRYELTLEKKEYLVTARYLGYKSFTFIVQPNLQNQEKNIVLIPQLESLETVVLELPITVKKDTIIYKVSKFTTGEERKLKDVLEKLPGVEVDREGNVYVQGKKVETLMVENKKFFGGDTKLAIENIPADAIDEVEALDNYNEISFLKDLDNKDELALNIKLKDGKKNFVFGNLEAGKGNEDFYVARSNLYYYSKKTSANTIVNFNNMREQTFTYRQYSSFNTGLNSVFLTGATVFSDYDNTLQQFVENEDVLKSRRQFGAINVFHEASTKFNLSGYGIFSRTTEESLNRSRNDYNTFTETRSINAFTDNSLAIGNLIGSYIPNLTDRWEFKTQYKYSDNNLNDIINTTVDEVENNYSENLNSFSNSFSQIIEWHRNKSKKHRFSIGASYKYEDGNPQRLRETTDAILLGLIPVEDADTIRLVQPKFYKNQQAKAILKHFWLLDRNNHIYTTLGGVFQNNDFRSSDYQIRPDGSTNDFAQAGFSNNLSLRLLDTYMGVYYKRKAGKFTFGQGVFLHNYDWKVQQQSLFERNKWLLLPEASIDYEINSRKEISFNYALLSNFSSAENYANGLLVETYNTLFRGNSRLENELTHSFSLNFRKFAIYRGFGYYVRASYRQQQEGVQSSVSTQEATQILSAIFLKNPSRNWRINNSLYRQVSKVKLSLGLGYDDRKFDQVLNGSRIENTNTFWNYRFSAKTISKDFPIIQLGLSQIWNTYKLNGSKSNFITTIPSLNVDYDFWDGFVASFNTSINYYKNKQTDGTNSYSISSANLFYGFKNSPWSFELKANNIFNVKFKNDNTITKYLISDNESFVLPRIFLLTIGYRL